MTDRLYGGGFSGGGGAIRAAALPEIRREKGETRNKKKNYIARTPIRKG